MKNIVVQLGLLMIVASGCTHSIHIVNAGGYQPYVKPKKGKLIEAESEQFTILGFTGNTDYVDQAYEEIQSQCRKGKITGVTTQFSTSHGFFSWTNKILIRGTCSA